MAWIIILGALWTYPILTYLVFRLTKHNLRYRKYIFYAVLVASLLTIVCLLTHISTTLSVIDWLLLTSLHFLFWLTLWYTQFQSNKLFKVTGIILLFLTFGLNYLLGSVGALGVAFVTAEYETDREKWLDDGLIVKEQTLGNAISDYRGKKVEIYKTLNWFPVLEWRLQEKKYNSIITYGNPLTILYKPTENRIYLSTSMFWGTDRKTYNWADTLYLKK